MIISGKIYYNYINKLKIVKPFNRYEYIKVILNDSKNLYKNFTKILYVFIYDFESINNFIDIYIDYIEEGNNNIDYAFILYKIFIIVDININTYLSKYVIESNKKYKYDILLYYLKYFTTNNMIFDKLFKKNLSFYDKLKFNNLIKPHKEYPNKLFDINNIYYRYNNKYYKFIDIEYVDNVKIQGININYGMLHYVNKDNISFVNKEYNKLYQKYEYIDMNNIDIDKVVNNVYLFINNIIKKIKYKDVFLNLNEYDIEKLVVKNDKDNTFSSYTKFYVCKKDNNILLDLNDNLYNDNTKVLVEDCTNYIESKIKNNLKIIQNIYDFIYSKESILNNMVYFENDDLEYLDQVAYIFNEEKPDRNSDSGIPIEKQDDGYYYRVISKLDVLFKNNYSLYFKSINFEAPKTNNIEKNEVYVYFPLLFTYKNYISYINNLVQAIFDKIINNIIIPIEYLNTDLVKTIYDIK